MLAATTGVVAASVISMGLISLPIMLRYGYDRRLASGVIAASGTLAQIIPPSLVLIIMADQLGKSVGDMYKGAFVPGFVLAGLYLVYVLGMTMFFPKCGAGPAARGARLPRAERQDRRRLAAGADRHLDRRGVRLVHDAQPADTRDRRTDRRRACSSASAVAFVAGRGLSRDCFRLRLAVADGASRSPSC